MVFGGDCIAKIDGKTVFIEGGILPGEKAEVETVVSKKDYDRALVKKILIPDAARREAFCDFYGTCGGCNFQHADYALQLELKKRIVEELLARSFGSVPHECDTARAGAFPQLPDIKIVSGPEKEYRSRFQLHNGGLKKRNADSVVFIDDCPCAVPVLRDFLRYKNTLKKSTVFPVPAERVSVCAAGDTVVTGRDAQTVRSVDIAGKRIFFDVNGFFQSNLFVLEQALPLITDGLCGKRLLDMYGGTGVLSLFAADKFEEVTIVESDEKPLALAKRNYKENGIAEAPLTRAMHGKIWAKRRAQTAGLFDAVIVDPPRTGIESAVIDYLCAAKPPVIRSLSCDPATHARDLKKLLCAGYTISDFYLLDFYPQTSHIETLARLTFTKNKPERKL